VVWLCGSLKDLQPHQQELLSLLPHTLEVMDIHMQNQLKRPYPERLESVENFLTAILNLVELGSLHVKGGERDDTPMTLLSLSFIITLTKAMGDAFTKAREHRSHSELHLEERPKKGRIVIDDACLAFSNSAEELLLRLLDDKERLIRAALDGKGQDSAATEWLAGILSLAQQVLAFRRTESLSRRVGNRERSQPRLCVFSQVGRLSALTFQALYSIVVKSELTQAEERLLSSALDFLAYLCENMHLLEPTPSPPAFARIFAMLHHLLQNLAAAGETQAAGQICAKKVKACYIDLLRHAPEPCPALVARAIPVELTSKSLPRLIASLDSVLHLFALNEARMLQSFKSVAFDIVHKLVDLVCWCGLQLEPTTDMAKGASLVHIISTALAIISHMITNRLFKIGTHAVSRVLGSLSALSVPKRRWAFTELQWVSELERRHARLQVPMSDHLPKQIFSAYYTFLYRLLKTRSRQTFSCMPLFLYNLRELLSSIFLADQGSASVVCASNLARLFEEISNYPKQFNKYVALLLVHYIQLCEIHLLSSATKEALLPGIYALMDICTEYE